MTGVGTASAATSLNYPIHQPGPVFPGPIGPIFPGPPGHPGQGNGNGHGNWHGNGHSHSHGQPSCNTRQLETWNLNDPSNTVDLTYNSGSYTYAVTIIQKGSCLTGSLSDAGVPTTGPISGTVNGNNVTFSFNYPTNSIQGKRTFTGTIGHHGAVSGTWGESGSEHGTGAWTLAENANPACPPWYHPHGPRECAVH
jgi:hypothetical protein